MSDIYLILRRRLVDVPRRQDWVPLGTETMSQARKKLGYSYEAVARKLNISSKTYERWEKAGEVPRGDVMRVADALELEIERPARERVLITDATPAQAQIVAKLNEILERLDRLENGEQPT